MTKGQKIIGSLLVVVAILLALNLSLEVSGQGYSAPPSDFDRFVEREEQLRMMGYLNDRLEGIRIALQNQPAPASFGDQLGNRWLKCWRRGGQ